MKQSTENLTDGRLGKKMVLFSVPLIITNLLQALYNLVDMIIVGHFAGSAGLSAVTISGQVTIVVFCIVMGITNAGSALVSHMVGSGRKNEVPGTIRTMEVSFTILAVVITVLLLLFAEPLVRAMRTPAESFDQAVWYLRICSIGTIFIYLYNVMNAILRGIGNSRTPMILIAVSSAINLVLDYILVGPCQLNAAGAAIATLSSQIFSAVLIFPLAHRRHPFLNISGEKFRIDRKQLGTLIRIGLPQSIQFTLTNLSFLFINSLINIYGVNASAAAGATGRISSFAVLGGQAAMGAVITAAGQNIAAGKFQRALRSMGIGILLSLPIALAFYLLCMFVPESMLGIFTADQGVIRIGVPFMRIASLSFVIESVMFCFMGLLTGAGYTNITLLCAMISSFGVRYGLAKIFSSLLHMGFVGVAWAYPFAPVSSCIICIAFILSGRWKKSRIRI